MKNRNLAFALLALSSVSASAAATSPAGSPIGLGEAVVLLQSRYPGKVMAIEFDASGDKPAHYHVGMLFAESGSVTVDVDAVTLEIASRHDTPLAPGSATLADAASLLATELPGDVLVAKVDATAGAKVHYDVDVRLPQGSIARLKVDAATRQIAWRNPAIVSD
jgi:uncharacterized membrane protein YkoI